VFRAMEEHIFLNSPFNIYDLLMSDAAILDLRNAPLVRDLTAKYKFPSYYDAYYCTTPLSGGSDVDDENRNIGTIDESLPRVLFISCHNQDIRSEFVGLPALSHHHLRIIDHRYFDKSQYVYRPSCKILQALSVIQYEILTNDMMAARSRIFTRRSSNCSIISSHSDLPVTPTAILS